MGNRFAPYGRNPVFRFIWGHVAGGVAVHNILSRKGWLVFGMIGGLLVFFSVSAEFASRRFVREAAEYQKKAEEAVKTMQKQTEQFQKQAEEASKAMEKQ